MRLERACKRRLAAAHEAAEDNDAPSLPRLCCACIFLFFLIPLPFLHLLLLLFLLLVVLVFVAVAVAVHCDDVRLFAEGNFAIGGSVAFTDDLPIRC